MAANLPSPAAQQLEPPRFGIVDVAMLLLATLSVVLVLMDVFLRRLLYDWGLFLEVVVLDLLITLVFLGEFVSKLDRRDGLLRVLRRSWFDILGMIPLAAFVALEAALSGAPLGAALTGAVRLTAGSQVGGLVRLFRFLRIVRIVQAWSRFLRATNMTFGEQVTKRVFDKYRRIIVAELTTPIMLAGLTVSQEIIIRMKFLESAGQALDAKRPEIHAAVMEALQRHRMGQSLVQQPLVERIVKDVEDAVVNITVDTLTGPELNRMTQEVIVEVLENFKRQLDSPEGRAMLRNMGAAPPGGA